MKKQILLALALLLPFLTVKASDYKPYEMPNTQVVPILDSGTGGQYELYIKLPDYYVEDKEKQYPVIYITDASTHIELLSSATEFLMEDVILVGISYQTDIQLSEEFEKEFGIMASRFRDYSIQPSSNPERQAKYQFGQADSHLSFIRNSVIKFIEENYRADPNNRSYFGYSLGGLFGAFALMTHPDTFKNYLLGSPSVWRSTPYLSELRKKSSKKYKSFNANVFMTYGSKEEKLGKQVEEFVTHLNNQGDSTLSVTRKIIDGDHGTAFPLTGVHAINWLAGLQSKENK